MEIGMSIGQTQTIETPTRRVGGLFVVSGPSGVGKDSLLAALFTQLPGVVRSISATTRLPRPGEVNGRDYLFLSRAEFESAIAACRFLEHVQYGESLYGTPLDGVIAQRAQGLDVVLKIEVQGALAIRKLVPEAVLIFIQAPSEAELERRLRGRNTDSEARIEERLQIARQEMTYIPHYDYLIVNDILKRAADALRSIVIAERHRIKRAEG